MSSNFRPGWSPDGSILVSAHAMNGGGPTAQIVDRGSWKTQRDFVGHKKAVTCTRFSNNLFEVTNRYVLVNVRRHEITQIRNPA